MWTASRSFRVVSRMPALSSGRVTTSCVPRIHTPLRSTRSSDVCRARGFHGACEPVSIDPDGRERLRFVPGDVPLPPYPSWAQTDEALASIAALMRGLHDASIGLSDRRRTWSSEIADPTVVR